MWEVNYLNVLELKKAALKSMNEKDDDNTLLELGDELLSYINQGYQNAIVNKVKPTKTTGCTCVDGRIAIADIADDFYDVVRLIDNYGMDARFSRNSQYIFSEDGDYTLEYICCPEKLVGDEDIPVIDEAFHYILSDYAVYRMYLKGSKARQARGDAFLSSYLNGLTKLKGYGPDKIRNKFGVDING